MRIPCPHCGERSVDEFTTTGSADPVRPESSEAIADWIDYVYIRDNPAGRHREWFHHVTGCRAWLMVTRDTRTHEIVDVRPAPGGSPR